MYYVIRYFRLLSCVIVHCHHYIPTIFFNRPTSTRISSYHSYCCKSIHINPCQSISLALHRLGPTFPFSSTKRITEVKLLSLREALNLKALRAARAARGGKSTSFWSKEWRESSPIVGWVFRDVIGTWFGYLYIYIYMCVYIYTYIHIYIILEYVLEVFTVCTCT